jgi:hypothetical protein
VSCPINVPNRLVLHRRFLSWLVDRAFVPEGQADSRQARSARVATQRGSVPEGRLKSLSVHRFLSSKLSPGMSKRQRVECSCRLETPGTPVEKFVRWCSLVLDVINGFCQLRDAHTESAIPCCHPSSPPDRARSRFFARHPQRSSPINDATRAGPTPIC